MSQNSNLFDGLDLAHDFSSPDKQWALYHAFMGEDADWIDSSKESPAAPKPPTRRDRLRQCTAEFLEAVDSDGPSFAYLSRNILRRLVWIAFYLMFLGLCFYLCYAVLVDYFSYQKLVTVDEGSEHKVEFPAVTLCNLNPLSAKDELVNHSTYGAFVMLEKGMGFPNCRLLRSPLDDPLNVACDSSECDDSETYAINLTDFPSDNINETTTATTANEATTVSDNGSTSTKAPLRRKRDLFSDLWRPSDDDWHWAEEQSGVERIERNDAGHGRSKRQAATNNNTIPDNLNFTMDVIQARARCSFIYQSQIYINSANGKINFTLQNIGVTFGDNSSCAEATWYNVSMTVTYNAACRSAVYCDYMGCYVNVTTGYYEVKTKKGYITRTSCSKAVPYMLNFPATASPELSDVFSAYSTLTEAIRISQTNDLSDLLPMYLPEKSVVEKYSPEPWKFINTCTYNRRHCSYLQFQPWITEEYGKCYTFNGPKRSNTSQSSADLQKQRDSFRPLTTFQTGPDGGLRLTINLNGSQYLSLLSPEKGLRVVLHQPWEAPFPAENGFSLAPGFTHSVAVRKTLTHRIGLPHGNCTYKQYDMFDYTETLCNKLCLEKEYRQRCLCWMHDGEEYDVLLEEYPELAKMKNLTMCDTLQQVVAQCLAAVNTYVTSDSYDCGCLPSCEDFEYSTEVTSSDVNMVFQSIVQNVRNIEMGDDLCNDMNSTVRLHLYFHSNKYTEVTHSPAFTFETLVANMGGNLGLFLGLSIMSLVEIGDYLLNILLILVSPKLYDWWQGESQQVQPNIKKKKVYILAGPPDYLSHGNPLKARPLRSDQRWSDRFNKVFMSD